MEIKPRTDMAARRQAVDLELYRAHTAGPLPGPVCRADCPDFGRDADCSRRCPYIPNRLSSAGADLPLEPLIAPLVFEMKRMGVFHPCWSCEGHNDSAGRLWKLPRVWFYADSLVHLRCLGDALEELQRGHSLSARWALLLTHSEPRNPDTTFSLEPTQLTMSAVLSDLHQDIETLSGALPGQFWKACKELRAKLDSL